MAASLEDIAESKKKRKRRGTKRKLLVGESVEVRSTEEGFAGSWHSAKVIEIGNSTRRVRYDNMLVDDESDYYSELIQVSNAIDGVETTPDLVSVNYRNIIRPQPPKLIMHQWGLHYGLCVDIWYRDALWEGVILDHEDGSDERLVFFPDIGDQQLTKVEDMRITRDWDEVTEEWKSRGHWLLLELIEEHESEWPLFVSVQQLWNDLRFREDFMSSIKDWTCLWRSMWNKLVIEVLRDGIHLIAKHAESVVKQLTSRTTRSGRVSGRKFGFDSSRRYVLGNQVEETQPLLALPGPEVDTGLKCDVDSSDVQAKRRRCNASDDVSSGSQVEKVATLRFVLKKRKNPNCSDSKYYALPCVGDPGPSHIFVSEDDNGCIGSSLLGASDRKAITSENVGDRPISTLKDKQDLRNDELSREVWGQEGRSIKGSTRSRRDGGNSLCNKPGRKSKNSKSVTREWLPAGKDIVPEPKYCPDALESYAQGRKYVPSLRTEKLSLKVRMHLAYIGWEIEYKRDKTMERVRYIDPSGKCFYSLPQVCKHMTETKGKVQTLLRSKQGLIDMPVKKLDSSVHEAPFSVIANEPQASEDCYPKLLGNTLALHHLRVEVGQSDGASSTCVETLPSDVSEGEKALKDPSSNIEYEPEYCPCAMKELYELGPITRNRCVSELRIKAKKHLSSMNWKFIYFQRRPGATPELRYISPTGKQYGSLRTACKACMDGAGVPKSTRSVGHSLFSKDGSLIGNNISSAMVSARVMKNILPSDQLATRYLESGYEQVKRTRTPWKTRQENFPTPLRAFETPTIANLHNQKKPYKRNESRASTKQITNSSRLLRSSKRARQVLESSPAHHTPRSILSWLIDNSMVLPRAKVCYINRKDQVSTAEGKITREGIRCSCCQKVFGLGGFEVHAGSKTRNPGANICLEDGRSLLDCQKQLMQVNELKSSAAEPFQRIKSYQLQSDGDLICSVCHYGGTLIMCDHCPSSFHLSCIGLEKLPDGSWFCSSCRCGICSQSDFNGNIGQFTKKTVIYCDQCEREYHVKCLRKIRHMKLDGCPEGNWFCSKKCEKIFLGLHKLLGKSISAGVDNLSWTILRDGYHKAAYDIETLTEHQSKLSVALAVLHECFEPIKEPKTKDLVRDVLFNKRSLLRRLDFKGFYTILLEKEDELISVATVRVYGEKVAEVPLVGTRFQFRRRGMCRILMNVLEKKLKELGVERLILPAIPRVLHAWTTSFGFSKMPKSERMEFLEYVFLDFQDTTMCQKMLKTIPRMKIARPRGNQQGLGHELNQSNESIDFGTDSTVPEVILSDKEQNAVMERLLLDMPVVDTACNDSVGVEKPHVASVCSPLQEKSFHTCQFLVTFPQETQLTDSKQYQPGNEISIGENCFTKGSDPRKEEKGLVNNGCFKYYRRRKFRQQSFNPITVQQQQHRNVNNGGC